MLVNSLGIQLRLRALIKAWMKQNSQIIPKNRTIHQIENSGRKPLASQNHETKIEVKLKVLYQHWTLLKVVSFRDVWSISQQRYKQSPHIISCCFILDTHLPLHHLYLTIPSSSWIFFNLHTNCVGLGTSTKILLSVKIHNQQFKL